MSQSLAGLNRPAGRLVQGWSRSALALAAAAGGVLVSAGEVHATPIDLPCPDPFNNPTPAGFIVSNFSGPSILQPPTSSAPGGTCEVSEPFNNQVTVDIDFEDNLTGVTNGIFSYTIESLTGPFQLASVDSDTDGIGGTTSVFKEIFSDASFSTRIGAGTSTNGSQESISLSDKTLRKLYVRDTYSANGTTKLDNMTNSYLVPGPLPILGAGAAFGFTRKLRSRIRASRQASAI